MKSNGIGRSINANSYNANGNTTVENNDSALTTYSWDIENHVTKVELSAGGLNTMTHSTSSGQAYDGDGKRRRYEDSVGPRNYIWDLENILLVTGSNDVTARNYTLAPELYGELISQRYSGATSFHHFDALGSTRNLTDANQAITDTREYKAFGAANISSGSNTNRFWWNGKWGYYNQTDAGDFWVRARIYRPALGRWISRDSADTLCNRSLYLYCMNTPISIVDPSGLIAPIIIGGIVIGVICLVALGNAVLSTRGKNDKWRHCVVGVYDRAMVRRPSYRN